MGLRDPRSAPDRRSCNSPDLNGVPCPAQLGGPLFTSIRISRSLRTPPSTATQDLRPAREPPLAVRADPAATASSANASLHLVCCQLRRAPMRCSNPIAPHRASCNRRDQRTVFNGSFYRRSSPEILKIVALGPSLPSARPSGNCTAPEARERTRDGVSRKEFPGESCQERVARQLSPRTRSSARTLQREISHPLEEPSSSPVLPVPRVRPPYRKP